MLEVGYLYNVYSYSCPLYSMCVADENIVATGDDEGNTEGTVVPHTT